MTTRTVEKEAEIEGDELVIRRAKSETRISLPAILEWVASKRPDLLAPYVQHDQGDDE